MYLQQKNLYINDDNYVMVDLNTYRIFYLTENLVHALQDKEAVAFSKEENDIWQIIQNLKPAQSVNETFYNAIKIHVSNSCNLACKYCYANGGNYGFQDSLMTQETADKILKTIDEWKVFQKLEYITFFGGEPLLAWKIINYICEHTVHRNVKYLLQTNGTVINEEILEMLKKYDISVTVSIDGPQKVHDFNRIDKNGNGTFQKVLYNIQKMKDCGVHVPAIQATLSSEFTNEYSREEIADIIYELTGVQQIKVEFDLECPQKTGETEQKREIEFFFDRVMKEEYILDNDVHKIISTILSKKYKDYICSAGNGTITVDVSGNLFPCQLFLDNKLMCMGKIGENLFTEAAELLKKSRKQPCQRCLAKSTCYLCAATGVNEKICQSKRSLTEKVLKYMTDLVYRDKYIEFYNKFKNLCS